MFRETVGELARLRVEDMRREASRAQRLRVAKAAAPRRGAR